MRLLLAAMLLATPASAAPLTLDGAREAAQERSLDVALARWDVDAARGAALQWTGEALPSVAGFVSGSTGAGFTAFGFERPVASQIGAGASISVGLVDPATWAAASAARRTVDGREATVSWTRVLARQRATELYARTRLERAVADALAKAADDASQEAEAVSALVAAGLRPSADSARVRAQQLDFVARSREAAGRAAGACAALQDLVAADIDGDCVVAELPVDPQPLEGPGAHPALEAARAAVSSAEAWRSSALAGRLPTVSADASAAHYTVPGRAGGFGWSAGFSVAIPLSVAGIGAVQQATAGLGRANEQLAGQRRALDSARVAAEEAWTAARSVVAARGSGLEAADAALTLVSERYRAGLSPVTALLDARAVRTAAEVGLLRAEASLWTALAALEAARGVE